MSFADPQSVTINAIAVPLPRTSTGPNTAVYSAADGSVKLSISHAYGRRNRRTVRLDHSKIAPDVFTADQARFTMSSYIVIDTPVHGYTPAEIKQIVDGLTAYLTASSGSAITRLNGGES